MKLLRTKPETTPSQPIHSMTSTEFNTVASCPGMHRQAKPKHKLPGWNVKRHMAIRLTTGNL